MWYPAQSAPQGTDRSACAARRAPVGVSQGDVSVLWFRDRAGPCPRRVRGASRTQRSDRGTRLARRMVRLESPRSLVPSPARARMRSARCPMRGMPPSATDRGGHDESERGRRLGPVSAQRSLRPPSRSPTSRSDCALRPTVSRGAQCDEWPCAATSHRGSARHPRSTTAIAGAETQAMAAPSFFSLSVMRVGGLSCVVLPDHSCFVVWTDRVRGH